MRSRARKVVQENESALRTLDSDANADYVLPHKIAHLPRSRALHIQNPYRIPRAQTIAEICNIPRRWSGYYREIAALERRAAILGGLTD